MNKSLANVSVATSSFVVADGASAADVLVVRCKFDSTSAVSFPDREAEPAMALCKAELTGQKALLKKTDAWMIKEATCKAKSGDNLLFRLTVPPR